MCLCCLEQGLLVLSPGGDLVLRLHTCYTRYTASLLLLLSVCFVSCCLYKPPSVSSWSSDCFFNGAGKRQQETGLVLQLLYTAWGLLVAKQKKDRGPDININNPALNTTSQQYNLTNAVPILDWGGIASEWVLQQCIKAKLFTELVANRYALLQS